MKKNRKPIVFFSILLLGFCFLSAACRKSTPLPEKAANQKKLVFIAGPGSHGYGLHEHNAGCRLLANYLNENVPDILAVVQTNGWPSDPAILDEADGIVIYCDGGKEHPMEGHFTEIDRLAQKGVGIAWLHFSLIVEDQEKSNFLLKWIGGYFETNWSVNPFWEPNFEIFPAHPITRGVKPFKILDEWYFNMRFVEEMKGVTPLLTAIPPKRAFEQEEGPYSGNPHVRQQVGMPEHMAWAYERPDGGRGFGFTGGHAHWNWAHNEYRKFILNALTWIAGADVPADGVPSREPTLEELAADPDEPQPDSWGEKDIRKWIEKWNRPAGGSGK